MFRPDPLMAHADGDGLRALQKTLGPVSKFFEVHALFPKCRGSRIKGLGSYPECSAAFSQHKYIQKCPARI